MAANAVKRAVVVGGAGALGSRVVSGFKAASWHVANLDLRESAHADANLLSPDSEMMLRQARTWLDGGKLDAVVHVAGGFSMGGFADGAEVVERMFRMNAMSAFSAGFLATHLLADPGLLVLTGALAAYEGRTGFAVGYGMSKAATHHLALDFNAENASTGRKVACVLPSTIDTPANREAMPDADFSAWTDPDVIAREVVRWSEAPAEVSRENIFVRL